MQLRPRRGLALQRFEVSGSEVVDARRGVDDRRDDEAGDDRFPDDAELPWVLVGDHEVGRYSRRFTGSSRAR